MQDLLDGVRDATVAAGGFNPFIAFGVLLVLVALAAFVLSRLQRNPAAQARGDAVFTEARRSAADHRGLARTAFDGGDWDTAVVESTRALAAELFERGLVAEEVGATADEIAARAALVFPDAGDRLVRAALVFDETRYGDRHADEARARELAALDEELRAATPQAGGPRRPVPAVPR